MPDQTPRPRRTRSAGAALSHAVLAFAAVVALTAFAACGDTPRDGADPNGGTSPQPPATGTPPGGTPATPGPSTVRPTVVRSFPHDPNAFTQGLLFVNGDLYESTGIAGESDIRQVDLTTGAVRRRVRLPGPYFGEGIAVLDGRLYQLTWRHGKAFVYDLATFAPRDTLDYFGEGWGLTTDGESLIMSDGTARLRFLDPRTFAVRRTLDVRDGTAPVSQLNELEMVEGELLANVWQTDQIARIDPQTGQVKGWLDLRGLLAAGDRNGREDVLNGIAYEPQARRLFVTGKWWSRVYEIALPGNAARGNP